MMKTSIKVWDLPTRLFHWLLVLSFATAYLTAESERLRIIHITCGYTVAGLLVFRLLWGLVGTRWAKFSSFWPSPSKAINYGLSLVDKAQAPHYTGHNPLGALAVYGLLSLGLITTAAGYSYLQLDQEWIAEVHEVMANLMLALVFAHVFGVVISSKKHKENLAKSMVTGNKDGEPADEIKTTRPIVALLLLAVVGGFWFTAWQQPDLLGLKAGEDSEQHQEKDGD